MRGAPSAADKVLIAAVLQHDIKVSPSQLERWRHHQLLDPGHWRRDGWGGSTVEPHDDDTLERVIHLGHFSARGRAWQLTALLLLEAEFRLSDHALAAAMTWWVVRAQQSLVDAYSRAILQVAPDPSDPRNEALDAAGVAWAALRRRPANRALVTEVQRQIVEGNPGSPSKSQIREWVAVSGALRVLDVAAPEWVDDEDLGRMVYGHDVSDDPTTLPFARPHQLKDTAATLTWAEIEPCLAAGVPWDTALAEVSLWRLAKSGDCSRPLSGDAIDDLFEALHGHDPKQATLPEDVIDFRT